MTMKVRTYSDAEILLGRIRAELESHEAANSLMLGTCGQLIRHPEQVKAAPCLKTVEDEHGLIVAALMTPPQKLVVYGHQGDLNGGTRILVKELVGAGHRVPGVLGPSEVAQKTAERWEEVTGEAHVLEQRLMVYELREVLRPVPERGQLRLAMETDVELASRWSYEFTLEVFGRADREEAGRAARLRIGQGEIFLWEDGQPVSMAMKTRPTRRGISVGGVYTPPECRRRGYATACVGELSRLLLGAGSEFCALFADLSNATPNRVYQSIGYRPVCDYDEYVFLRDGMSKHGRPLHSGPFYPAGETAAKQEGSIGGVNHEHNQDTLCGQSGGLASLAGKASQNREGSLAGILQEANRAATYSL